MRRRIVVMTLILALAGTVFLTSCEKSYHQVGERYVLVAANIKLPYWREAIAGFMDAAGVLGVKAEVMGPDAYNPRKKCRILKKLLPAIPPEFWSHPLNHRSSLPPSMPPSNRAFPSSRWILTPPTPGVFFSLARIICRRGLKAEGTWRRFFTARGM